MSAALLVAVLVIAPLSPSEGLDVLALGADQPSLAKLDAKCKKGVDLILRAPLSEIRKAAPISVKCAQPRFAKLGALLDRQAARCTKSDTDCAAWLLHAQAALVDVLCPSCAQSDFANVLTVLAAVGVGETIDEASATRAVDAASRASAAAADNSAVQRIALAAWLLLPASAGVGVDDFAKLIPRVLATNADDPDVWGAFVYMAQRTNAVEATKQFLDAVAETTTNALHRGKAYYLRGCLAMQEHDEEGARTAFALAAKADPFDASYKKATGDVAAGVTFQCKVVMTPFGPALKDVLTEAASSR